MVGPLQIYQVLRVSGITSRFELADREALSPLVGRRQEVGWLLDGWKEAQLLSSPDRNEGDAEACFRQALEVSQTQRSLSLRLRAAMSLRRLLVKKAEEHDAREILVNVYSSFTEGFDTADLKDVRTILEALS